MASLYKKSITITDPKTGRKTKSKSAKWWGQYKDPNGVLQRTPLSVDKAAAQAMLHQIVQRVERQKAGLIDPSEEQRKRLLKDHLQEFKQFLSDKEVGQRQTGETMAKIRRLIDQQKWLHIGDISAGGVLEFLGRLRREGLSPQTYNNYLTAFKQFTRWLVRDRRAPTNPLTHLSRINVQVDRRHDRRVLSPEEFLRLIEAARKGKRIEGILGPDRAMMYILAAWTGFRKGEIGSLTLRSFQLDHDPPTVKVDASYSKRRREDTQILHPDVAVQLKEWLARESRMTPDQPLFPVSGRVPGGTQRKTNKMIERDLMAARQQWLDEAKDLDAKAFDAAHVKEGAIENQENSDELQRRMESDFLCYCNHEGLYADFHGLRHRFITGLAQAGVQPKMLQTLARHSDIRLTLGVYTHVESAERLAAIQTLAPPPSTGELAPRI